MKDVAPYTMGQALGRYFVSGPTLAGQLFMEGGNQEANAVMEKMLNDAWLLGYQTALRREMNSDAG